jgi:2-haloacid dehalogenase
VTEEERDQCIAGYSELELRDGAKDCFEKLRSEGFTVWCFTTGDVTRVRGYFERAGVEMPMENFVSCDSLRISKPALAAYRHVFDVFAADDEKWFSAAHMWDVSAAKKVGFKGAYCTVYGKEPCMEIFDTEMEVVADTLLEIAEKICKTST